VELLKELPKTLRLRVQQDNQLTLLNFSISIPSIVKSEKIKKTKAAKLKAGNKLPAIKSSSEQEFYCTE
jgi:hypothetical protein